MSFKVEYATLDSTMSANKELFLSNVPVDSSDVALDIIGGSAQFFTGDFAVDTTRVHWSGYDLDGLLGTGDKVRMIYDRS